MTVITVEDGREFECLAGRDDAVREAYDEFAGDPFFNGEYER